MGDSPPNSPLLQRALELSEVFLHDLDTAPVQPQLSGQPLRDRWQAPLPESGCAPEDVLEELAELAGPGLMHTQSGRFFGWVIGGSLPSALAADWLTSAWDQNAGMHAPSPSAAIAEEVVGAWLKELLGIPTAASFALVTGCQMAHVTCLAAARNAVLSRVGWDVERAGLFDAPTVRIVTSSERHGSLDRALRLLGMGTDSLVCLDADEQGRLSPKSLVSALASLPANTPTIVVLQAGDLNIGAFDPFEELMPICRNHGAWVHVDGAFGLWARTCSRFDDLTRGWEEADSWSTDGHKWLNVPYDCGYAFVADPAPHYASMSHRTAYLYHDDTARDQIDWNPEYSRRARGFATWAAIRELGREGIADLVDRSCRYAKDLALQITEREGAELLWEPVINQGLVRFRHPSPKASDEQHEAFHDAVVAAIVSTGEAFFGSTTWRGLRCLRISVTNWRTNDADVERAVTAAQQSLETCRREAVT